MVSSLPFLAPVFLRKAKEYRSKYSNGSSGTRSKPIGKGSQIYKLGSVSREGAFATATGKESQGNSSEENILHVMDHKGNTILKSVSYSVHVDEESGKIGRGL